MEIDKHWKTIQTVFQESRGSSTHYAVATVNEDGSPSVTPIGALFLRSPTFWQKSLLAGKFETPPAVRLTGSAGKKREATEEEIAGWQDHVKLALGTKGHALMWKNMRTVRDISFDSFEPVSCGEMTQDLCK